MRPKAALHAIWNKKGLFTTHISCVDNAAGLAASQASKVPVAM